MTRSATRRTSNPPPPANRATATRPPLAITEPRCYIRTIARRPRWTRCNQQDCPACGIYRGRRVRTTGFAPRHRGPSPRQTTKNPGRVGNPAKSTTHPPDRVARLHEHGDPASRNVPGPAQPGCASRASPFGPPHCLFPQPIRGMPCPDRAVVRLGILPEVPR